MAKRRARVVCSACHERKIKCDLRPPTNDYQALSPCSACSERGTDCRLRSRKPYTSIVRSSRNTEIDRNAAVHDGEHIPKSVTFHIDRAKVTASYGPLPGSQTSSLYFGDSGYGSLMDILDPPSQSIGRHLTIQTSRDSTLPAEDLGYLNAKGCFALPDESHELLKAYFQFVHPQFPVLNGPAFLRLHADGRLETINLMLLWSMFSVSANYVPTCRAADTKTLYHMRAKTLFDLSGENDKYVLIQSSLLLSFFFDDVQDVKQSWYWSGIAFNLAQSLGLHEVLVANRNRATSELLYLESLWECCILRDAWLSYTMGRPLRLGGAQLSFNGGCRFKDMVFLGERLLSDVEADASEKMWQSSVDAATALHLALQSKPMRPDKLLFQWQKEEAPETSSLPLSLCYLRLRLCQYATIIAVVQLDKHNGLESGSPQPGLVKTAADEIDSIIQSYLRDDMAGYVPLMIVPLVMPALLVSMSVLKSDDPVKMERAARKLSTCFDLFNSIEHSFPAASIVKRLFGTASQGVLERQLTATRLSP